jgi:putative alpha-1,2-mannosidase
VVELGDGAKLEIEVVRAKPTDPYIQSFTLNGKRQKRAWFHYDEIVNGGKLVFYMSETPDLEFASALEDAPPSLKL